MLYNSFFKGVVFLTLPFIVISCSNDDDDISLPSEKVCKIVSVVSKYGGSSSNDGYTLNQFSYDNEGRIIAYQYNSPHSSTVSYEYIYGNSLIIEKSSYGSETKFYLKDGLVENAYEQESYEYDNAKQLTKISVDNGAHYTNFYWNNGNIQKWESYSYNKLDYEVTCTYTDYLNTLSLLYWGDSDYYGLDEVIYAAGYYGKITKHLPKTLVTKYANGDEEITTFSYSEFNADGYPSRVNIDIDNDPYGKEQFDLTWK